MRIEIDRELAAELVVAIEALVAAVEDEPEWWVQILSLSQAAVQEGLRSEDYIDAHARIGARLAA